jgi:hypothetical protein
MPHPTKHHVRIMRQLAEPGICIRLTRQPGTGRPFAADWIVDGQPNFIAEDITVKDVLDLIEIKWLKKSDRNDWADYYQPTALAIKKCAEVAAEPLDVTERCDSAVAIILKNIHYTGIDHKDWLIDQVMRTLLGPEYAQAIEAATMGEPGGWPTGRAPE